MSFDDKEAMKPEGFISQTANMKSLLHKAFVMSLHFCPHTM